MEARLAYLPMDRRQAMAQGRDLPDRTSGAALSADISGFTPLSEALVQALGPQRGAEALTNQLNAVYSALVAEVHRYRGSIVGFSGDAIHCWFDGDGEHRAIACALAMQGAMPQFRETRITPALIVSLHMKVVVVSGQARRFVVGNPDIQVIDVLAGAILDRMAAVGKQAQQDEVVADLQTIERLGRDVTIRAWHQDGQVAVVEGLASYSKAAPWLALAPAALPEAQIRPWLLPVVWDRLKTRQGEFLAELRPAVSLFLKFGGLEYDEDDAAGRKLDRYIRWVQHILAHYEGYLIQLTTGDKDTYLYAAFGAPLAHDDDAARAVAAALELRSLPTEMAFISQIQIGISQGRMRAGAYGSLTRRTYGVLGDEVNVAARLMEKAEAGQILVSKRVADSAASKYRLQDLGSIAVKGKQAPVPAFAVLDRRLMWQRLAQTFTTPLVGRHSELAQVQQILESVTAGAGQVLRLEGVAGVGKSRLAAELVERAEADGFRVATGACESTSVHTIYYPWRQIFYTLLRFQFPEGGEAAGWPVVQVRSLVADVNPAWLIRLPLLGDLLDLPIPDNETTAAFDRKLRQEALLALATEMVQAWARNHTLLLFIEDAHWLDEGSRNLVLALGRTIARLPVLLALVHRPEAEDNTLLPELNQLPWYHHLLLHELSPSATGELVANQLSAPVSSLALSLIQTVAQGNPFFGEELVKALRETGQLCRQQDGTWALSEEMFNTLLSANCLDRDAAQGQWRLARGAPLSAVDLKLSDPTEAAILSRFDRLPDRHQMTLKVAAAIGPTFEFDLLALAHPMLAGPAVLADGLELLERGDWIRQETPPPRLTYAFKHHITQEAVYDTLLQEQRQALHRAIGQSLETLQPEAIGRLAYHYGRSAVRGKALAYLGRAAEEARKEFANETALNYYNQALALEERYEWLKGKVEVLHVLGRREDELDGLLALETAPGARDFDVALLQAQYDESQGDYDQARANIRRAMATCPEPGKSADRGRCLIQLGLIARRQGSYAQARELYRQALELLPTTCPDDKSQALNGLGTIHRQMGDFEEARACYEEALALSRDRNNRFGEAQALDNLGTVAYHQRDFAQALIYHWQGLEMRRVIGDRAGEGASLGNLALATRDAGDYTQALAYLSEALTIHQAIGNRWEEVNDWSDLGVLFYSLGDLPTAQTHLQQGLALSRELGDQAGEAYVLGNLGLVLRDLEALEAAEEAFNNGLILAQEQADQYAVSYFLSHLSLVSLYAGRLEEAIGRAQAALALRRELDLPLWTTADLTTLAAAHLNAGNMDEALSYARQALTILNECGGEGPEFPHRDFFVCYQVLLAAGENEAANAALESAHNLVVAQAGKIADDTLRQTFLQQVQINRRIESEYAQRRTQGAVSSTAHHGPGGSRAGLEHER